MSPRPALHAVVLAGGAGERFWPRSRADRPKPLLRVVDGESLLGATVARARAVAGPDRVWMICGQEHAAPMRRESGLPAKRVIVEPRRRNTAMAVAVAATRIAAEDPEAVMVVLPADHHIPERRAFARDIRRAALAAAREDVLVTLGVRPTRPETGYGYIRLGKPVAGSEPLHRVARFVEKPDAARARRYLRAGGFLWNAGIFVWRAARILAEIERHAPEVHRALRPLLAPRGRSRRQVLETAYRKAPSLPIDTAVLERSKRLWCLPVEFAWSDVGTWESLAENLGVGAGVNRVIDGEAVLLDSDRNLVWAGDRPVVLLGVEGLAVIDAEDAILITPLERSGDVRQVVERLRGEGRKELI